MQHDWCASRCRTHRVVLRTRNVFQFMRGDSNGIASKVPDSTA